MWTYLWTLCLILPYLTSTQELDALMARNHELHLASDEFEDCLDNLKIPYEDNCDFQRLQMEANAVRAKHNLPIALPLTHSTKVTLDEHRTVATLQCLPPSLCFDMTKKCDCRFNKLLCTKKQSLTDCKMEYKILLEKILAAELAYNKAIIATNSTVGGGHNFNATNKKEKQEKFNTFSKASDAWRECKRNFAIPFNGACDVEKYVKASERLINISIENENDLGLIPLSDEIEVAKLLCLYPSECNKISRKCICRSGGGCNVKPQDKGVTCAEEFIAFLKAFEAISGHRVTIPNIPMARSAPKPGVKGRSLSGVGANVHLNRRRHLGILFGQIYLGIHLTVEN